MTLQNLYDKIGAQLKICPRKGEDRVCIELEGGYFGGISTVDVRDAYCGIDWNDGKFIITPVNEVKEV